MGKVNKLQATPFRTRESLAFGQTTLSKVAAIVVLSGGLIAAVWSIMHQNEARQNEALQGEVPEEPVMRWNVIVQGQLNVLSRDHIVEQLESMAVKGFIAVDVSKVKEHLELLPWVYKATVKKEWPNTLSLDIEEQTAVAKWRDRWLMNEQGHLFTRSSRFHHLPLLEGPEGLHQELLVKFRAFKPVLAQHALQLKALTLTERRALTLTLSDGISLFLGREDIDRRVGLVGTLLDAIVLPEHQTIEYIDMRYDTGVAIGMKNSTQSENREDD